MIKIISKAARSAARCRRAAWRLCLCGAGAKGGRENYSLLHVLRHEHLFIYTIIHLSLSLCISLSLSLSLSISLSLSLYIYIYIYIHLSQLAGPLVSCLNLAGYMVLLLIYIMCMYVCMYVCIYIYIYCGIGVSEASWEGTCEANSVACASVRSEEKHKWA